MVNNSGQLLNNLIFVENLCIMKNIFVLFSLIIFVLSANAQKDTINKKDVSKFFAAIHTSFSHDFSENTSPQTVFSLNTALIGYSRIFSEKVDAVIIYDVTRTTNLAFPDTIGITSYFEGSKYTAFLKMAQIRWKISPMFEFFMGQLLNEQYLTLQDKHWGRRYIATTFQEFYRFGMPADFGARLRFIPSEKLKISINAFNGEGPFRYQDNESGFLFAGNIEYHPHKNIILKAYADIQQAPSGFDQNRSALSAFAGFKNEKWIFGLEYNTVINNAYVSASDMSGLSFYGVYKFNEQWAVLSRVDFMTDYFGVENECNILGGMEYRPEKNLGFSINYRRNTWLNTSQIFLNAGLRF